MSAPPVPAPGASYASREIIPGVRLAAPAHPGTDRVLTAEAAAFVAHLVRRFRSGVEERLAARRERMAAWRKGVPLDFSAETRAVREADWRCAPVPQELQDRRVEITGPPVAKMVIHALNSGANVFMADFEDANAPTFANCVEGHEALMGAVRRTLEYTAPDTGKRYRLGDELAVLFVRPRGWHLEERHVLVDGEPAPAALFDAGLYLFHNARESLARGSGPYLYLPKMESHLEARLWNEVLREAEDALGIARGAIKVTCLIETLPAAFEMDEILYELRERSAGLNCGRWDYIFSCIKVWSEDATRVLPDRGAVGMDQPFLRAYTRLLVKTCHRRGVHAMGGMAAQIPIKGDEARNAAAIAKVRADKLREVTDGHDGTWVAHPALVPVAREVFDAYMPRANQIDSPKQRELSVTAADLVAPPSGERTLAGLAHNIEVGISYLAAWLGGSGAVPLHGLMEDAATAEISRTQVWQQLRHGARLASGEVVDAALVERTIAAEAARLRAGVGDAEWARGAFPEAVRVFAECATSRRLPDFLTLPAYEALLRLERAEAGLVPETTSLESA